MSRQTFCSRKEHTPLSFSMVIWIHVWSRQFCLFITLFGPTGNTLMNKSSIECIWLSQSVSFLGRLYIQGSKQYHIYIYIYTHIYIFIYLNIYIFKQGLFFFLNWEGNGNPLQYSCLENPMGRGAWWAAVHGVAKSRTRLSDFTLTFHFHALEKEMATHSSVLAWRIPGTGEPHGLPSMGLHRVGHDWSNLAAIAAWFFKWYNYLRTIEIFLSI